MIKVLVVLPFYGGSLPIGKYCARALEECGCLVEVFETSDFYDAYTALKKLNLSPERYNFLLENFVTVISQAVCAKAERFRPDLVLCMAQAPLDRKGLEELRKAGIMTAMWFVEDYKIFTYWRSFAQFYDIFAVIQKEPFLSQLEAIGQKNHLYLPMAALPDFHKKYNLTPDEEKEFSADLSFLGAPYPNRVMAFMEILNNDFKIWGDGWEEFPEFDKNIQRQGARITPEEVVKVYSGTKINLNLHSGVDSSQLVSKGDFVNPRTFELAGAGLFQLVDKRSLMSELFEDDELVKFKSMDELKDKISYYLDHPEEREKVALAGQKRVHKEHQYKHRMQKLLDFSKSINPDLGVPKEPSIFTRIPEDLAEELRDFVREESLSPDASFDDFIRVIRKKSGVLTELEAGLLFIDEWAKQYDL